MSRQTIVFLLAILVIIPFVVGCNSSSSDDSKTKNEANLLIYCGITMVKPMRLIADNFEKENHCKVILNQGGSEDLYQSLHISRKGDLYLPGSEVYRKNHLAEGLLGDYVYLGFNKASFLVQKGNPKNITSDLKWLLDEDLVIAIGNPEMCSIGKQTKNILTKVELFDQVTINSFALSADSRTLNNLLRDKTVDLMVNWRATAFFENNRDFIDVIDLAESISPPKKLLLNMLTFSQQKELARKFMDYASSPSGQAIFREFGFLEEIKLGQDLNRTSSK